MPKMGWTIIQEGNVFQISPDNEQEQARTFKIFSNARPDGASKQTWFLTTEIVELAMELFGGDGGDSVARMETAWTHLRKLKHPSPAQHPPGSKEARAAQAELKTATDLIDPERIEEHRRESWLEFYAADDWEKYQDISNGRAEFPEDWPEGVEMRAFITKANHDEAFSTFEAAPGDDVESEPEAPTSELHRMVEAASRPAGNAA